MAKRTKRLTSQGEEKEDIRINKFLSEAGVCSRREADRYVTEGKVKIDGVVAEMGSRVTKDSQVTFLGELVKREEKLVLIAFNKPEGIVCTTDRNEPDNIIDFIDYGMRIYPIGRLDKDSEGLILLTNDGNIVNRILRAENHHEKEYIVTVNKEINAEFIKNMSSGVPVLNTVTNPCTITQIDRFSFNIILTQGLNRQIRRMCEYLDYRVVSLKRIRIMNIQLGRLKTGDYRNVTEKEIEDLNLSFSQAKQVKAVGTTGNQKNETVRRSDDHSKSPKSTAKTNERRKPGNDKSDKQSTVRSISDYHKPAKQNSSMSKQESRYSDKPKSEGNKHEGNKSDGGKPDYRKTNSSKSHDFKSDHHKKENHKPDFNKSMNTKRFSGKSSNSKPENGKPDSRKLSGSASDSRKSSGSASDSRKSFGPASDSRKHGYKSGSGNRTGYTSGSHRSGKK